MSDRNPEVAARYERLHAVFERARELAGPERSTWLQQACGGDTELREEVQELLACLESGAIDPLSEEGLAAGRDALEELVGGDSPARKGSRLPERIGDYRIEGFLGQGGMGIVYAAVQESPRRRVAIKLLHRHAALSPERLRRFRQEAELLGRLHHPGIAQIFEAGTFQIDDGEHPYFAMELVEGVEIGRFVRDAELSVPERLELLAKVADAVQHAHDRGVIHRDLKPDNLLVTADGAPKILDFGIARESAEEGGQAATAITQAGMVLGTLAYMAPEQLGGERDLITTRADVYALGVVAYELLTGRLPHDLAGKRMHEAARIISTETAPSVGSLDPRLRGDVETIVGKALAKEEERRYPSAAELARDIRRHLAHEPITGRPPTAWYTLTRFARRNRVLFGGVAATLLALLIGLAGTARFAILEARQRSAAEANAKQAELNLARFEKVADFQSDQLRTIDPPRLGVRLQEALLESVPAEQRAALEQGLAGTNFTNVALAALEQSIFAGTIEAIEAEFADEPLLQAQLYQSIGVTLSLLNLLERARGSLERALAIRDEELGPADGDTLASLAALSTVLRLQGDSDEAERLARTALDGFDALYGGQHLDTLAMLNNLALIVDDAEEEEALIRRALEGFKLVGAADEEDLLTMRSNLAMALSRQGRSEEAVELLREVLEERLRIFGEEHPGTPGARVNLGMALSSDDPDAERLLSEGLAGARRMLGDQHIKTLLACLELGRLLEVIDKARAEPYFRDFYLGSRRALGETHPTFLSAAHELGDFLRGQDRAPEAEPLLREAMEGRLTIEGHDDPATLTTIWKLGKTLLDLGRDADAELYLRDALDGRERVLGHEHARTLDVATDLALLLYRQRRGLEEALSLLERSLAGAHSELGDDDHYVGLLYDDCGRVLTALGRFPEAEEALLEGQAILFEARGAEARSTRYVAEDLVALYEAWGAAEPGAGHEVQAQQWRAELAGR